MILVRESLEIRLQTFEKIVDHLIHIVFRIIVVCNLLYLCFNTLNVVVLVIQLKTQKDLAVVFTNGLILRVDFFIPPAYTPQCRSAFFATRR